MNRVQVLRQAATAFDGDRRHALPAQCAACLTRSAQPSRAPRPGRTVRWLLLLIWLCAALPLRAAGTSQGYSFAALPSSGTPNLAVQALTPEEREFLKHLPTVRVGVAKPGLAPYESIGKDGSIAGLHPQILGSLARTLGFRIQPVVYERWSELLEAAKGQEVDLLMSVTVTPDRAEFLQFTLGVSPRLSGLFTRPGQPAIGREARFAVLPQQASTGYVKRQMGDAQMLEVADELAALQALRDQRADYYLGDLLPTLDLLQRQGVSGIELQRTVEHGSGHYHFAVRKGLAPLARILNKGITVSGQQLAGAARAALSAVPGSMLSARSRRIDPRVQPALVERPVWRVGAVKGLTLASEADEQGQPQGLGIDHAEAVARPWGVGLLVQSFDSEAAVLDALRAGSIDIAPLLIRTADRARDLGYSRSYAEMPHVIVTRSDAPLYWDLASLRGKRVALAARHALRDELARRYPDIRVLEPGPGKTAMDAVAEGLADAALEVPIVANLRIRQDMDGRLRTSGVITESSASFYFATSAQARPLVGVIDEALAAIPAAEHDRMLRYWIEQGLAPHFAWQRYRLLLGVAALALLLMAVLGAWWRRRLRREQQAGRRWQTVLHDVAGTSPGVSFRYRVDTGGQLQDVYVSPNAPTLLGSTPAPGATLSALLAPGLSAEDRDRMAAAERHSHLTGERLRVDLRYQLPGGPLRWLRCEAVRTHDEQGRDVWTGFVTDATTEHGLQQQLTAEAEARHLMLAEASRDLRAPTQRLSSALQNIDRSGLDAASADALLAAQTSARTLALLLDTGRPDEGQFQLRPVSFDLPALLDGLAQFWALVARAKGLAFQTEFGTGLPTLWLQDPVRLRQLLSHLLSNACRYTQQGGITLAVRRQGQALIFSVQDTGRGLTALDQARLFPASESVHETGIGGTGAGSSGQGLAMCRRIATLGGGQITVHSKPGAGSEFTVWLPLETGDLAPALSADAAQLEAPSWSRPARLTLSAAHPAADVAAAAAAHTAQADADRGVDVGAAVHAASTPDAGKDAGGVADLRAKSEATVATTDDAGAGADAGAAVPAQEEARAQAPGELHEMAPAQPQEVVPAQPAEKPSEEPHESARQEPAEAPREKPPEEPAEPLYEDAQEPAQEQAQEQSHAEARGATCGAAGDEVLPAVAAAAAALSPANTVAAADPPARSIPERTGRPATAASRIVICDNDARTRLQTAQMLRQRGCEVFETDDAESALILWTEHQAKVVITDLELPGHDGRWLIYRIRERESSQGRRTALIVCSVEEPPAAARARLNGPDAYLRKPVPPELLVARLIRLGVLLGEDVRA